MNLEREKK